MTDKNKSNHFIPLFKVYLLYVFNKYLMNERLNEGVNCNRPFFYVSRSVGLNKTLSDFHSGRVRPEKGRDLLKVTQ